MYELWDKFLPFHAFDKINYFYQTTDKIWQNIGAKYPQEFEAAEGFGQFL